MLSPKNHIEQFLESRGLKFPDSRPLYQYRLTDNEYVALRNLIKYWHEMFGVEHIAFKNDSRWDAAFILYASEWWRREYNGDWGWHGLFLSVNIDSHQMTNLQKQQLTKTGFQYWGRTISVGTTTKYLASIALEGGLPLQMLASTVNTTWLTQVLQKAVENALMVNNFETKRFVTNYLQAHSVSQMFKTESIYITLTDMVHVAVALIQKYQLYNQDNPSVYLDNINANWREEFPLPLGDGAGANIINRIIGIKMPSNIEHPFQYVRILDENNHLVLNFEFKSPVKIDTLFPNGQELPPVLDTVLVSDEGDIIKLGKAISLKSQEKICLRMPTMHYSLKDKAAKKGYSLQFKHLSTIFYPENNSICSGIDDEPWGFINADGIWTLAGVASFKTKADTIRILYPNNLKYSDTNESIEYISSDENKTLIQATGNVILRDEDSRYVIETHIPNILQEDFFFTGDVLSYQSNYSEVYIGIPSLNCLNKETGYKSAISNKLLIARPVYSTETPWAPLTNVMVGYYEVRLCDENGAVKFRKRCFLLPPNFSIQTHPIDAMSGEIRVSNIGLSTPICHKGTIIRDNDNNFRVLCSAENTPLAYVPILLTWPTVQKALEIMVPFPAMGALLVNQDGLICRTPNLCLNDLYGYRVLMQAENFIIRMYLADQTELRYKYKIANQTKFALIDYFEPIKALFSITTNLDSQVKLTIGNDHCSPLSMTISRYEMALERDNTLGSVSLTDTNLASLTLERINNIHLKAMRISIPEQAHIDLESNFINAGTHTGKWLFHPEKRVAEPWLIYSAENSSVQFRPLILVGEKEKSQSGNMSLCALSQAAVLSDYALRIKEIKSALSKMAVDFGHESWGYIQSLWENTKHLPLSCLDVWSLSATDHHVLVALTIQLDSGFLLKLNSDFPVFWELIPLSCWMKVFSKYRLYLENNDVKDNEIRDLINSKLKRLSYVFDNSGVMAAILNSKMFGFESDINPLAILNMIYREKQNLLIRHADDTWPNFLKEEILGQWLKLDSSIRQNFEPALAIENLLDHQRALVLLPVIIAAHFVQDNQETPLEDLNAFKCKRIKSFDEQWFSSVFGFSLMYFVQ